MFHPQCWYVAEILPAQPPGWNKVGKIAGIIDKPSPLPDEDHYKLHVGWRMVTIEGDRF